MNDTNPTETPQTPKKRKNHFEANSNYFTICVYVVATFVVCLICYKFLNNWKDAKSYFGSVLGTLSPFLLSFLIVYFINPLVNTLDKLIFKNMKLDKHIKLHKYLALILAYIIFVGIIVLIITFVVPQIISSIMRLVRQMSNLYRSTSALVENLSSFFPNTDFDLLQAYVDEYLPDAIKYLQSLMRDMVPRIYDTSVSILGWIVNIIMAFVISCYLMSDKLNIIKGLKQIIYALFDQENAYKILITVGECNRIFGDYIIGKALDSVVIGIICGIAMGILRLPYAMLISVLVGITNMIPYFGPFIGAIPSVIILLIVSPKYAFIFLILVLVLQQFDGTILGPKILGSSTGLSPIWIIFAITVGGALGGVLGMFVGVPITAVLHYLASNLVSYLLYKKKIHPNLENVVIPDINPKNVFIPKDFVQTEDSAESGPVDDTKDH